MSDLKPRAPKMSTVIISTLLVLVGHFGHSLAPFVAENGNFIALGGFVLLLLGIFLKGL